MKTDSRSSIFDRPLLPEFANPGPNDHYEVPQVFVLLTKGERGHVDVREGLALSHAMGCMWTLVMCASGKEARQIAQFAWRAGYGNVMALATSQQIALDLQQFHSYRAIPMSVLNPKSVQIACQRNIGAIEIPAFMNAGLVVLSDDDIRANYGTAVNAVRMARRYRIVSCPSDERGEVDKSALLHLESEITGRPKVAGSTASFVVMGIDETTDYSLEYFPPGLGQEDQIQQLLAERRGLVRLHDGVAQFPYDAHVPQDDRAFREVFGELAMAGLVQANPHQIGINENLVLPTRELWQETRLAMSALVDRLEPSLALWAHQYGLPASWRAERSSWLQRSLDRTRVALDQAGPERLDEWARAWLEVDRPRLGQRLTELRVEGARHRRETSDALIRAATHVCPRAVAYQVVDEGVRVTRGGDELEIVKMTTARNGRAPRRDESEYARALDAILDGSAFSQEQLIRATVRAWELGVAQSGLELNDGLRHQAEVEVRDAFNAAAEQMRNLVAPSINELVTNAFSLIKPGGYDSDLVVPPEGSEVRSISDALISRVRSSARSTLEDRRALEALIRIACIPAQADTVIRHTLQSCIPGETAHPQKHIVLAMQERDQPFRRFLAQLVSGQSPEGAALADALAQSEAAQDLLQDTAALLWDRPGEPRIAIELLQACIRGEFSRDNAIDAIENLLTRPPSDIRAQLEHETLGTEPARGLHDYPNPFDPRLLHSDLGETHTSRVDAEPQVRLRATLHTHHPDAAQNFIDPKLRPDGRAPFWLVRRYPDNLREIVRHGGDASACAVATLTNSYFVGSAWVDFASRPELWTELTEILCKHALDHRSTSAHLRSSPFDTIAREAFGRAGSAHDVAPHPAGNEPLTGPLESNFRLLHETMGLAIEADRLESALAATGVEARRKLRQAQFSIDVFDNLDEALSQSAELIDRYVQCIAEMELRLRAMKSRHPGNEPLAHDQTLDSFACAWAAIQHDPTHAAAILRSLAHGDRSEAVGMADEISSSMAQHRSAGENPPFWCLRLSGSLQDWLQNMGPESSLGLIQAGT